MKTLVIMEQGLSFSHTSLSEKLHVDVSLNSFPNGDGVAIFECGQTLDTTKWEPDYIIKVGACEAYPGIGPNFRVDAEGDWEPELYEILETQQTSDVGGSELEDN